MDTTSHSPVVLNVTTATRIGRTLSIALNGLKGHVVTVEADIGNSLPGFTLLGLPDQSLHEAKDRIRAAARNTGLALTRRHLTVNLTPAALHKRGPIFDLAILMAAWGADYAVHNETGPVFLAAIGLDGTLQSAPGVLPAVIAAVQAGHPEVVVAQQDLAQAQLVPGAKVRAFQHVSQVAQAFGAPIEAQQPEHVSNQQKQSSPPNAAAVDFAEIHGQHEARWAVEIAATGGHNMYLHGPPGAGKTMLAQRLPTILPPMDPQTALENTAINSLVEGRADLGKITYKPPFQAPHHTATAAALIGGGIGHIQPGAVSQAHGGVLFLDEAAEFPRQVLDALRQPLETGKIILHRAKQTVEFPAQFQLLMASNPCPCGQGYGTAQHCRCTSLQRRRYQQKISGPLLDRIDLQVAVEPLSSHHLAANSKPEDSATIAQRVAGARTRAHQRLQPFGISKNHQIPFKLFSVPELCVAPDGKMILDHALDSSQISARGYGHIMRVAWTIADLMGAERPAAQHIDMALYFRLTTREEQHGA